MQAMPDSRTSFEHWLRCIERLAKYLPRLKEYEKLFGESASVREALSDFYSIVVEFHTKAVRRLQERGMLCTVIK